MTELTPSGYVKQTTADVRMTACDGFSQNSMDEEQFDVWLAEHDQRVAEIAVAERGPRHKVGDPIVLPSSKYVHGLLVRPCSRKHREMFLRGYLVLSCRKCSMVRFEDGEDPS